MKFRFTSVVTEDFSEIVRNVTVGMQNDFNESLSGFSFGNGIDQFTCVIVACVGESLKDKFREQHDKVGTYKHPFTKEKVRFMSVAIVFDSIELEGNTEEALTDMFGVALIKKLNSLPYTIPKGLDFEMFLREIETFICKS